MLTEREFKLKYLLTRKELKAFNGEIPMDQDLFDKIADKMMGRNIGENTFEEFLWKYQNFLPEYKEKVEYERLIGEDPEGDILQEKWENYKEKNYPDPYLENS